MKSNLLVVALCASCVAGDAESELASELTTGGTYDIAQAGLPDHSDAARAGTIAWYFKTYGPSNTFVLATPATYELEHTLRIPTCATLTTNAGSQLRAAAGLDDGLMILMAAQSTLSN